MVRSQRRIIGAPPTPSPAGAYHFDSRSLSSLVPSTSLSLQKRLESVQDFREFGLCFVVLLDSPEYHILVQ